MRLTSGPIQGLHPVVPLCLVDSGEGDIVSLPNSVEEELALALHVYSRWRERRVRDGWERERGREGKAEGTEGGRSGRWREGEEEGARE